VKKVVTLLVFLIFFLVNFATFANASIDISIKDGYVVKEESVVIGQFEIPEGVPYTCALEAVKKDFYECVLEKKIEKLEIGFPIVSENEITTVDIFFSDKEGFEISDKKISYGNEKDIGNTFFMLFIPLLCFLIVGISNINRPNGRYLVLFFGSVIASVVIGPFVSEFIIDKTFGLFICVSISGLIGLAMGKLAGEFSGWFMGAFAGVFVGIFAGKFSVRLGWENADTSEYIFWLLVFSLISFVLRELIVSSLTKKTNGQSLVN